MNSTHIYTIRYWLDNVLTEEQEKAIIASGQMADHVFAKDKVQRAANRKNKVEELCMCASCKEHDAFVREEEAYFAAREAEGGWLSRANAGFEERYGADDLDSYLRHGD